MNELDVLALLTLTFMISGFEFGIIEFVKNKKVNNDKVDIIKGFSIVYLVLYCILSLNTCLLILKKELSFTVFIWFIVGILIKEGLLLITKEWEKAKELLKRIIIYILIIIFYFIFN